jgi:hypothetical protein
VLKAIVGNSVASAAAGAGAVALNFDMTAFKLQAYVAHGTPLYRSVPSNEEMLKYERHELLRSGTISKTRVGLWRDSGLVFSSETIETARMMGYET